MRHTPRSPRLLAGSLAAVAVLALAGCGDATDDPATEASGDPTSSSPTPSVTPSESTSTSPSTTASEDASQTPNASALALYFVGKGPRGDRLFPYQVMSGPDAASILQALTTKPADPDYRTVWTASMLGETTTTGTEVTVDLTDEATRAPQGVNAEAAKLSIQQVVWSLRSAMGATKVSFTVAGQPATTVLGQPVKTPVAPADFFDTSTQVSITAPLEGATVSGTLEATGANNGFEAWLGWELLDANGKAVKSGNVTADGYGEKLYPWKASVDLAGVAPGTYTFRAYNEDASGGEGGGGPEEDTRTVIVG